MNDAVHHAFLVPTLKSTGGTLEVLRLAQELRRAGSTVTIASMWGNTYPIACEGVDVVTLFDRPVHPAGAALSLPLVFLRFAHLVRRWGPRTRIAFTHYSTYPMAFLVPRNRRWFFVQDLEWCFVPAGAARSALKAFILTAYRGGRLLSANQFLTRALAGLGLPVAATADIWADPFFLDDGAVAERDHDIALILRKGAHKRADWGLAFLEQLHERRPGLRVLAISPDEDFREASAGATFLLRPSRAEIRDAYQRSRVFVLFSDQEGFGLPPLEAMGSGCVPLCRDAGGVAAYMTPMFDENLIPLEAPPEMMIARLLDILDDRQRWERLSIRARTVFRNGLDRAARRLDVLAQCGFVDKNGRAA